MGEIQAQQALYLLPWDSVFTLHVSRGLGKLESPSLPATGPGMSLGGYRRMGQFLMSVDCL